MIVGINRRSLIAAAVAVATAGSVATAPAAAQSAPTSIRPTGSLDISRLVRTALFVSDLEAATRFYRDTLGLEQLFFQGEFSGPEAGAVLGVPASAKVTVRILKAEGMPYGMIGLFHVAGAKLQRVRKKRGSVNIGEGILVFYMPALDPLVERLRTGGWTIVSPPVKIGRSRELMFYGPDDVLINVMERDHRATP